MEQIICSDNKLVQIVLNHPLFLQALSFLRNFGFLYKHFQCFFFLKIFIYWMHWQIGQGICQAFTDNVNVGILVSSYLMYINNPKTYIFLFDVGNHFLVPGRATQEGLNPLSPQPWTPNSNKVVWSLHVVYCHIYDFIYLA